MAFGQAPRATATDPLFIVCFALATILNFMPVMLAAPLPVEIGVVGAAHLLLLARLLHRPRRRCEAAREPISTGFRR